MLQQTSDSLGPISTPDAINRRFNGVLPRSAILSIRFGLGATLGMGLLGVGPPGLN